MNYYDELGLPRTASPVEIQQAYRALVKIIHPDKQQEDDLKKACDLQLRRLNQIISVLGDPAKRREYDLSLLMQAMAAAQRSEDSMRRPIRRGPIAWGLAAAIAIAGIVLWMRAPVLVYSQQPARSEPVAAPAAPVRVVRAEPAPAPLPPAVPTPTPAVDERKSADRLRNPLPVTPLPAARVTPPIQVSPKPAPKPAAPTFTGKWLAASPRSIELKVLSQGGRLRGQSSGDVNFQFEGPERTPAVLLPWRNSSGSRGELQLKQVSPTTLEVNWITTETGSDGMSGSGRATLAKADR